MPCTTGKLATSRLTLPQHAVPGGGILFDERAFEGGAVATCAIDY